MSCEFPRIFSRWRDLEWKFSFALALGLVLCRRGQGSRRCVGSERTPATFPGRRTQHASNAGHVYMPTYLVLPMCHVVVCLRGASGRVGQCLDALTPNHAHANVNASSVNMFKNRIDRYLIRAGYTIRAGSQWLPCPLAIWNLLFEMAILLNLVK